MARSSGPKMTTYIDSDTRGFEKGVKQAKKDLKDFDKVGKESLKSIGDMFGVPVGKLEQMVGATRELGRRMEEMGGTGEKALGKLLKSCNTLAAGIAGLGIAGAVTAFKALSAEAENFSNTIDGLNFKMQTETWLNTYKQAMHDANQETGRSFAQLMAGLQRAWTDMGYQVGGFIANGGHWGQMRSDRANAKANANDAAYAANELADAQKALLAVDKQMADLTRDIAAARLKAYDTKSAADIAAYTDLLNQKYNIQEPILRKIYELTAEINSYSNNTLEDVEKENAAYRAWTDLAATRDNELKSLLKLQKSVTAEVTTQVEETDRWVSILKDLKDTIAADRADLNFWGIDAALNAPSLKMPGATTDGLPLKINPVYDKEEVQQTIIDLSNVMEDAFMSASEALGGLVGDLMTGGDAFGNFSNAAVSAFGDMAISVGRLAISTGVATLGIKKALESLNGWVAIAAGTALVALGTAVKSGLSNIATGNYSGGGSVATGGYSSASRSEAQREITVNVSGKLQANGNVLEAVLEANNKRKAHTV